MAKRKLKKEIGNFKKKVWNKLLAVINTDVWGFPYKMVMGKLRQAARPMTESLGNELISRVKELFPEGNLREPILSQSRMTNGTYLT